MLHSKDFQTNLEAANSSAEQRLAEARRWCDNYEHQHPGVFFLQYGSSFFVQAGEQKAAGISQSDIDLRCVVVTLPTPEEQLRIRRELEQILGEIPVEMYFTLLSDYNVGKIGGEGTVTNVEVLIGRTKGDEDIVRLEHGGLLAVLSLATSKPFSSRTTPPATVGNSDAPETVKHIKNIITDLELTHADVVEWVHHFLRPALADYRQAHFSFESIHRDYVRRLAKSIIRIAFGMVMSELDEVDIQKMKLEYAERLRLNPHSVDSVHVALTRKVAEERIVAWCSKPTLDLLDLALEVREYGFNGQLAPDTMVRQMEDMMLLLASQMGTSNRRDAYAEIDVLLELVIHRGLKEHLGLELTRFPPGSQLLSNLSHSPSTMYFVPRHTVHGERNSIAWAVRADGQKMPIESVLIGTLRTLLSKAPHTVRVIVGDGGMLEAYEMSETELRTFLHNSDLRRLSKLVEKGVAEQLQEFLLLHSLLTHLSYTSIYFVRDLTETVMLTEDIVENPESWPPEISADNPLQKYLLTDYAAKVLQLCENANGSLAPGCSVFENASDVPSTLFNVGDVTKGKLYFVLDGNVQISGFPMTSHTITLQKNSVFGEASLNREKGRSAAVKILPHSRVLAIDATRFEQLTESLGFDEGLGCSPRELLYHIGTVNIARILRNIADVVA